MPCGDRIGRDGLIAVIGFLLENAQNCRLLHLLDDGGRLRTLHVRGIRFLSFRRRTLQKRRTYMIGEATSVTDKCRDKKGKRNYRGARRRMREIASPRQQKGGGGTHQRKLQALGRTLLGEGTRRARPKGNERENENNTDPISQKNFPSPKFRAIRLQPKWRGGSPNEREKPKERQNARANQGAPFKREYLSKPSHVRKVATWKVRPSPTFERK